MSYTPKNQKTQRFNLTCSLPTAKGIKVDWRLRLRRRVAKLANQEEPCSGTDQRGSRGPAIVVKVVNILGNDTRTIVEISV